MADPVVGQIWDYGYEYLPPVLQPGGIGTPPTAPVQQPGELTGAIFTPCGHSILAYSVAFAGVGGVPSALLLCPFCRYVIQIITPANAIYANDLPYISP